VDCLIRKILARYRADKDEHSPEETQSWMDYMQSQSDGLPLPETAKDLIEHSEGTGQEQVSYNPYDYTDPSDKPKETNGPPFVSEIPPETDIAVFQHPVLFKEDGDLEEWNKDQQDYTEDEQEQFPALSVTRKYATVQGVIAQYLMDSMPIVVSEDEFDSLFRTTKLAASLDDVVDKDYHYLNSKKMTRSDSVSAVWINKGNAKHREKGFFQFRVSSPGSKTGPHTVYLQFLRGEEEKQYPSYAEYPVQLACTCASFLFHGAQYYAVHDGYMYMPAFRTDLVAPKPQNMYVLNKSEAYPNGRRTPGRGLNFRVCKHLLKVYELLGRMKIEAVYRKYPVTAPPSKLMNKDVWKEMMKFEFTEANIKQKLKAREIPIPTYYTRERFTPSVQDWFYQVWMPRNDDQKIKALHDLVEYPERIYFLLLKEAKMKRERGETISDRLIHEGYALMNQRVQEENDLPPEQIVAPDVPAEQLQPGHISPPGEQSTKTVEEFIKEPEPVEDSTKPVPSELAPSMIKERPTPEDKRKQREEKRKEEQKALRERGLSEQARRALKRFQDETQEPRKEKLRQLGKRPFYEE